MYEVALAVAQRQRPARMARTAHANLRGDWFEAVSAQKGSEVLAVQTLRNALMSASAGTAYVRRAGVLRGWGLRQFVLLAPAIAFILHPVAGPIAATSR